jgi:hypothetical protein
MNWRRRKWILGAAAAALLALSAVAAWSCLAGWDLPSECIAMQRLPRIRPDYSQTVIPPNIAALNFLVEEPGVEYRVRIHGDVGGDILIGSRGPGITIPPQPWRELLSQNRGRRIVFDIYAKGREGGWSRFDPINNDVAKEEIDSHLAYRLLGPVCNLYRDMGIYQRNLENYDESPIVTSHAAHACVNCHTFSNNRPDTLSFQLRPEQKKGRTAPGMIVVRGGHAFRVETQTKITPKPPAYTSWHPGGSVAAFAMIRPMQYFRGAGAEIREVLDSQSDLAAVNVQTGTVLASPGIADPARLETFPAWSADGKVLYFSSAKSLWAQGGMPAVDCISKIRYDLMCVRYDIEKDTWGEPEMVLSSAETGKSISEPRASPDGRYLLFCMSNYGTFPVHQPSSDLYLMEIKSRKYRRLECNSSQSESWHCWSSNSRWIVFSSKRDNGLLARPYFCYIDSKGREHKPFVLPQKDPAFYDTWLKTYNVPELISGSVSISQEELLRAIDSGDAANDGPSRAGTPAQASEDPYGNN